MIAEILAIGAGLLALFLANTAAWSRKDTWMRPACFAAMVAMLPLIAASPFFALSHSAPVVEELWEPEAKHQILKVFMRQDVGIWLLLLIDSEPRLFHFPWDNDMANRLNTLAGLQMAGGAGSFMQRNPPEDDNPVKPDFRFDQYIVPPSPPKLMPKAHRGGM